MENEEPVEPDLHHGYTYTYAWTAKAVDQKKNGRPVISDIFALITPLSKPNNPRISEKITPILPLMTNECERS